MLMVFMRHSLHHELPSTNTNTALLAPAVEEALDPSKEQIMMLNNGCLCCTVRDDLVDMLNKLVRPWTSG